MKRSDMDRERFYQALDYMAKALMEPAIADARTQAALDEYRRWQGLILKMKADYQAIAESAQAAGLREVAQGAREKANACGYIIAAREKLDARGELG